MMLNSFPSCAISYLLNKVIFNIAPTIQPFNSHIPCNPIGSMLAQRAVHDPVLLEAYLFHSAVHLDHLYNRPWGLMTLYHRGQAIRLLNKRLECAESSISDNIIAAVALLGASGVRIRPLRAAIEC